MNQKSTWQNILIPEPDHLFELYHENSKQHQFGMNNYSGEEIESLVRNKHSSLPMAYEKLTPLAQVERDNIDSNNLSISFLSELLANSYGTIPSQSTDQLDRVLQSHQNLFPLEIYICTNDIKSLENGLWHYNIDQHALELIKSRDSFNLDKHQTEYVLGKQYMLIYITGIMHDIIKFQGEKAYRNILLEAGKVLQNIFLLCRKRQIYQQEIINYNDYEVEKLLEIDGIDHMLLAVNLLSMNSIKSTHTDTF